MMTLSLSLLPATTLTAKPFRLLAAFVLTGLIFYSLAANSQPASQADGEREEALASSPTDMSYHMPCCPNIYSEQEDGSTQPRSRPPHYNNHGMMMHRDMMPRGRQNDNMMQGGGDRK